MESQEREEAAKRIARLSKEQVAKLLIFMAGMEAQRAITERKRKDSRPRRPRHMYYINKGKTV